MLGVHGAATSGVSGECRRDSLEVHTVTSGPSRDCSRAGEALDSAPL